MRGRKGKRDRIMGECGEEYVDEMGGKERVGGEKWEKMGVGEVKDGIVPTTGPFHSCCSVKVYHDVA